MAWVQRKTRSGTTKWVARWRDAAGREHSRSFDKRGEAAAFAHDAETDARSRRPDIATARATLTIKDWLDSWLDEVVATRVRADRLRPRTAAGYETAVRLHIAPVVGHLLLVDQMIANGSAAADASRPSNALRGAHGGRPRRPRRAKRRSAR